MVRLQCSEEKLRAERDKAQKYLDVAGVMMVVIDSNQKVILINKKGCDVLGCAEQDVIGENWFDTFLPERNREEVKTVFERLMAGEVAAAEYHENPVLTKSGEEKIILWHNSILADESGAIIATLSSGQDLTELKRAHAAWQQSENTICGLLNAPADTSILIDTEGIVLAINQTAAQRLRRSVEDLVGLNIYSVLPPSLAEERMAHAERVVRTKKPARFEDARDDFVFDNTVYPVFDTSGNVVRLAIYGRDITELKRAYESLQKSENRYRMLAESIKDVIWTLDIKSLRFTYMSPSVQLLRGFTAEEAMEQSLDQTLTPSSFQFALQGLKQDEPVRDRLRDGSMKWRTMQLEHTCKDGSTVWAEVIATFLCGPDGSPVEVLGVSRDVTARRQKIETLRAISLVDELTGLHNRRGFLALGEQQLKIAHRARNRMAVFFIDLDNMKQINDVFGHEEGDSALKEIGVILTNSFRESDIIARIGGDEFAVMALEAPKDSVEMLTRRLREKIEARNVTDSASYQLSVSIGVASYDPVIPCTIDALLSKADSLMYEEKNTKRILGQAQFLRELKEKKSELASP
jgi:diguanylate cyclase (GGDEF)-like protein/PAS domain S-box-containing protein